MDEATKVCSRCKQEKPLHRFGSRSNRLSKLKSQCKDCDARYMRGYNKVRLPPDKLPAEKECALCHAIKPISEFGKNNGFPIPACKPCSARRASSYRYQHSNRALIAVPDSKVCTLCGNDLSWTEFRKDRTRPDGLNWRCKKCEKSKNYVRYRLINLLNGARKRSRERCLPFDLDLDWMLERFGRQKSCPILGFDLDWESTCLSKRSCTLDRLAPRLGYTKDNVWLICALANSMKSSASFDELLIFSRFWLGQ